MGGAAFDTGRWGFVSDVSSVGLTWAVLDSRLARVAGLPGQIQGMHLRYGAADGRRCGECAHLVTLGGMASVVFKCDLSRLSHSTATDWRRKWPACGRFEQVNSGG
jgi:hypothetical protein